MREQVHLFVAAYKNEDKIGRGGGLVSKNEEWTVLEMLFEDALNMIENQQIINARTIILLYHLKIDKLM